MGSDQSVHIAEFAKENNFSSGQQCLKENYFLHGMSALFEDTFVLSGKGM
jgi:hypothetical protein